MAGATTTDKGVRGAQKKEAFHRAAEERIVPFSYKRPDADIGAKRTHVYLGHSDIVTASVQIYPKGGGNVMHYHPGADGFWMVLKGRMRFHGPDGVIGEYGPHEGVIMPRNARYWFESALDDEETHLLHVNCDTLEKVQNPSIIVDDRPFERGNTLRFNYPEGFKGGN